MKNPALTVPTIDKRKRIPTAAIDSVVQQIIEKFHPLRIILFGSYAYGKPRPDSDVDLLVIMNTQLRESEQAIQILQQLEFLFGLDLLVITPQRLSQRLEWGDSFLREVIDQGKVLYESANA